MYTFGLYIFSPLILIIGVSNLLGTHYYTPFDKQRISNRFLIIGAYNKCFIKCYIDLLL